MIQRDSVVRHPYLHGEVGRLHLWAGGEVFEQELVTLLEPQIYAPQRLVVERPDTEQALLAVVDVQHLQGTTEA